MSTDSYHKRKLGNRVLQPETQMMGYGYDPALSEGSLKPPIFLTSTFVFRNAQDGKDFFDYTSGRRQPPPGQAAGLVYSRFNNPNLEVLEDRLGLWEGGESAAVFSSGMSAISTTLWAYLKPNDSLLMSEPLYGGTETLIDKTLPAFGIGAVRVADAVNREAVMAGAKQALAIARAKGGKVGLLVTETPATGATPGPGTGTGTGGSPDFRLAVNPADGQTITLGQAADYTINTQALNGFSGPIALRVVEWSTQRFPDPKPADTLPLNVSLPASTTAGVPARLRIQTTAGDEVGIYYLVLEASGGGITKTIEIALVIDTD